MSRPARRTPRALPAAALALATALLAACSGDGATGPGGKESTANGLFSGNVSGHVSRALTGVAYYGQATQDGATGFAVGMGALAADQKTFKDLIVIAREQGAAPAPGTYALYNSASDADPRAEQFVLASTLQLPSGGDLLCAGTTGTVTFAAAAGGRLTGSYTTQASCVDPASPAAELRVTLAGSFDAVESSSVPSAARAARHIR